MRPAEYKERILTVMRAARRALPADAWADFVNASTVKHLFESLAKTRSDIATAFPEIASDLPPERRPSVVFGEYGELVETGSVRALMNDASHMSDLLRAIPEKPPEPEGSREGLFLQGRPFDALRRVGKILAAAKGSIILIDAYIDESVLDLISAKAPGVTVEILTDKLPPAVKVYAAAFNREHGGLSIRSSRVFHDRFLIVDHADFYHLGQSVKDAGKRGGMFSRVEEPTILDGVRALWATAWSAATPVVEPPQKP